MWKEVVFWHFLNPTTCTKPASVVERPLHLTVRLHSVWDLYNVLKAGDIFVAVLTRNLKFDSKGLTHLTIPRYFFFFQFNFFKSVVYSTGKDTERRLLLMGPTGIEYTYTHTPYERGIIYRSMYVCFSFYLLLSRVMRNIRWIMWLTLSCSHSSCLERKERLISATESSLSSTLSETEFSDSDWLSPESSTVIKVWPLHARKTLMLL